MSGPTTQKPSDDGSARPKVMRRPAQFSRKTEALATTGDTPILPPRTSVAVASPPLSVTPPSSWQEDGRFGIALILVVGLVNLLLALVLHHTAPPKLNELPAARSITSNGAAMPSAIAKPNAANVTVYSEPSMSVRDRMDLEALPEDYNEFETQPDEMPVPTARGVARDEL